MPIPSYATDLTDVTTTDDNTNWSELVNHTGGTADAAESDYFIQGAGCVSQGLGTKSGTNAGLQFDYGSDLSGSFAADDCLFMWQVCLAGNAMSSYASGGMRVGIAGVAGDMDYWITGGNDFGRNPYGGWHNVAVDPTFTPDFTEGTPNGQYRYFGSLIDLQAVVSKGNMHGVDKLRYGRGDLIVAGGSTTNPCTFLATASSNDSQSNRWGLFQSQAGSFLHKGQLSIGAAASACHFVDSNRAIFVDDVTRTYPDFNRFQVTHASSVLEWNTISITALGSAAPGNFEVVTNASVTKRSCNFNDMGTFVYQNRASVLNTTYRRCGTITQGSAVFTGCTIADSYASVAMDVANGVSTVTDTVFESTGSGYAMEGFTVAGTYTLENITLDGYAVSNGSTGNEAVHVLAATGSVVLNVTGGTSPTYDTEGAAVTIVLDTYNFTLTGLKTDSEVRIYNASTNDEHAGIESSGTSFTYNYEYTTDQNIYVVVFHTDWLYPRLVGLILSNAHQSIPLSPIIDRVYNNP